MKWVRVLSSVQSLALSFATGAVLCSAAATAQFEDPATKVRELAEDVARQMEEIDRLLLQRGSEDPAAASAALRNSAEKIGELLDQTTESQQGVVDRIDELITTIQKMAGQGGGGGGSSQDRQQQQGEQQPQRQPGQRQQSDTSEAVDQRPGEGEQLDDADGPQRQDEPGTNRENATPEASDTEQVERDADASAWGRLQMYEQMLKTRGGPPRIPDKYRRYYEAFLERARKQAKERAPR